MRGWGGGMMIKYNDSLGGGKAVDLCPYGMGGNNASLIDNS